MEELKGLSCFGGTNVVWRRHPRIPPDDGKCKKHHSRRTEYKTNEGRRRSDLRSPQTHRRRFLSSRFSSFTSSFSSGRKEAREQENGRSALASLEAVVVVAGKKEEKDFDQRRDDEDEEEEEFDRHGVFSSSSLQVYHPPPTTTSSSSSCDRRAKLSSSSSSTSFSSSASRHLPLPSSSSSSDGVLPPCFWLAPSRRRPLYFFVSRFVFLVVYFLTADILMNIGSVTSDYLYFKDPQPKLHDRFHDWILKGKPIPGVSSTIPDILAVSLLCITGLRHVFFVRVPLNLLILYRFMFLLSSLYIIRGIAIFLTTMPTPVFDCKKIEVETVGDFIRHVLQASFFQLSLCTDMIVSGHTSSLCLCIATWLYYANCNPPEREGGEEGGDIIPFYFFMEKLREGCGSLVNKAPWKQRERRRRRKEEEQGGGEQQEEERKMIGEQERESLKKDERDGRDERKRREEKEGKDEEEEKEENERMIKIGEGGCVGEREEEEEPCKKDEREKEEKFDNALLLHTSKVLYSGSVFAGSTREEEEDDNEEKGYTEEVEEEREKGEKIRKKEIAAETKNEEEEGQIHARKDKSHSPFNRPTNSTTTTITLPTSPSSHMHSSSPCHRVFLHEERHLASSPLLSLSSMKESHTPAQASLCKKTKEEDGEHEEETKSKKEKISSGKQEARMDKKKDEEDDARHEDRHSDKEREREMHAGERSSTGRSLLKKRRFSCLDVFSRCHRAIRTWNLLGLYCILHGVVSIVFIDLTFIHYTVDICFGILVVFALFTSYHMMLSLIWVEKNRLSILGGGGRRRRRRDRCVVCRREEEEDERGRRKRSEERRARRRRRKEEGGGLRMITIQGGGEKSVDGVVSKSGVANEEKEEKEGGVKKSLLHIKKPKNEGDGEDAEEDKSKRGSNSTSPSLETKATKKKDLRTPRFSLQEGDNLSIRIVPVGSSADDEEEEERRGRGQRKSEEKKNEEEREKRDYQWLTTEGQTGASSPTSSLECHKDPTSTRQSSPASFEQEEEDECVENGDKKKQTLQDEEEKNERVKAREKGAPGEQGESNSLSASSRETEKKKSRVETRHPLDPQKEEEERRESRIESGDLRRRRRSEGEENQRHGTENNTRRKRRKEQGGRCMHSEEEEEERVSSSSCWKCCSLPPRHRQYPYGTASSSSSDNGEEEEEEGRRRSSSSSSRKKISYYRDASSCRGLVSYSSSSSCKRHMNLLESLKGEEFSDPYSHSATAVLNFPLIHWFAVVIRIFEGLE
ncbi:transmembrane protein [Cystoisospora suis]|uniref:Transmembrane protein n=1 Tax=Cystoisospora suis TaxID=483139 RepID=A0A2C6KB68_9APIC|nr:transmembrane protein [Cystoisospora suis]